MIISIGFDSCKRILEETGLKVSKNYFIYVVLSNSGHGKGIADNKNLMKKFDQQVDKISDAVQAHDKNVDQVVDQCAIDFVKNDFSNDPQVLARFTPTSQEKQQLYKHRILPAFEHYKEQFEGYVDDDFKF